MDEKEEEGVEVLLAFLGVALDLVWVAIGGG